VTTRSERAMDDYLIRLERSLADIPSAKREEIVSEIEAHMDEALAEAPDSSEASVRNVLDRLGDPDEIASEARERLGVRRRKATWLDPVAIILLLVGGFLWIVGWAAGVILLWLSDVWNVRQKIIGTLFVPGGLLAAFMYVSTPTDVVHCRSEVVRGLTVEVCEGTSDGSRILAWAILIFLVVAPIATAIYLGRALSRARRPT
jgi:uncharacterized membrane protein